MARKGKYKSVPFNKFNHRPFFQSERDGLRELDFFYFVRFGDICKIGSSKNPRERIMDAQRQMKQSFDEYHIIPAVCASCAESELRDYYRPYRCKGYEWFRLPTEEIEFLRAITGYRDGEFLTDTHPNTLNAKTHQIRTSSGKVSERSEQ